MWWMIATSKYGPSGSLGVDQVAGVGDVLDDRRRDPPARIARDQRFPELQPQVLLGIDTTVHAAHDEQAGTREEGEPRCVLPRIGGGEPLIAFEQRRQVGHGRGAFRL